MSNKKERPDRLRAKKKAHKLSKKHVEMIRSQKGKMSVREIAKWFQKNISEAAGFESKGKILLDKKGAPISSSSIMLTRDDWLRFGMYVIELMKDKNSCEAKKLQEAFENAIPTKKKFAPQYAY